jgi:predicted ATPase
MLKSIKISRFKSIEEATLTFGQLNFFIGTNASGKSNFFDALRLLQAMGYGFTVSEMFDGKAQAGGSVAWEGIRGGSERAVFRPNVGKSGKPKEKHTKTTCQLEITYHHGDVGYSYAIQLNPSDGIVQKEKFSYQNLADGAISKVYETLDRNPAAFITAKVFSRGEDNKTRSGRKSHYDFNPNRPLLHQLRQVADTELSEADWNAVDTFIQLLGDIQKLDVEPRLLRDYSKQTQAVRIGERGENFAALVKTILKDEKKKSAFTAWLKELTPTEIDEVKIGKGAVGEPIFGVREGRNTNYAPTLSDGTLRFSALTAALFQESSPHLLLLEEVDNGIHPTRLRLLVELLVQRTEHLTNSARLAEPSPQLFVTTHSPILLSWLPKESYKNVFHCSRQENGASKIQPIAEIPSFMEIARKQPFGELFAEGWIENSL